MGTSCAKPVRFPETSASESIIFNGACFYKELANTEQQFDDELVKFFVGQGAIGEGFDVIFGAFQFLGDFRRIATRK